MITAVLDANIFVSAVISPQSFPAQAINMFLYEKQFTLILSPPIIKEVWRVIFQPQIKRYKKYSDENIKLFLLKIQALSTLIIPTIDIHVIKDDPTDDKFIIAAIEGRADYIVSGDQHLLSLGSYENIEIVTPKKFVEILGE